VVPRRGMQPSITQLPQSAALGLNPVARRDGTLSWRCYTAATGGIRTERENVGQYWTMTVD